MFLFSNFMTLCIRSKQTNHNFGSLLHFITWGIASLDHRRRRTAFLPRAFFCFVGFPFVGVVTRSTAAVRDQTMSSKITIINVFWKRRGKSVRFDCTVWTVRWDGNLGSGFSRAVDIPLSTECSCPPSSLVRRVSPECKFKFRYGVGGGVNSKNGDPSFTRMALIQPRDVRSRSLSSTMARSSSMSCSPSCGIKQNTKGHTTHGDTH